MRTYIIISNIIIYNFLYKLFVVKNVYNILSILTHNIIIYSMRVFDLILYEISANHNSMLDRILLIPVIFIQKNDNVNNTIYNNTKIYKYFGLYIDMVRHYAHRFKTIRTYMLFN